MQFLGKFGKIVFWQSAPAQAKALWQDFISAEVSWAERWQGITSERSCRSTAFVSQSCLTTYTVNNVKERIMILVAHKSQLTLTNGRRLWARWNSSHEKWDWTEHQKTDNWKHSHNFKIPVSEFSVFLRFPDIRFNSPHGKLSYAYCMINISLNVSSKTDFKPIR